MEIRNITELTQLVNTELNSFCDQFQEYRKEVFKMKRVGIRGLLFRHTGKGRNWSINPGGGTELQFHLYLNEDSIGYGLGFNTQYVPHKNKLSTVQYMQPYAESFLSQPKIESNLINLGYSYLHGDKSGIENLEHNKYVLIGKEIPVERKKDHYQIKTSDINQLVKNIKEELFDAYKLIVPNAILIGVNNQKLEYYHPKKRSSKSKQKSKKSNDKIEVDIENLIINDQPHDYIGDHKKAMEIGEKAEQIVLNDEISFLSNDYPELAKKVCSVANNPNLGFDILSFETDGSQKQIEVKAIAKHKKDYSFILSKNELNKSKSYTNYYLYGVTDVYSKSPKILRVKNPDFHNEELFQKEAITFKVKFS